MKILRKSVLLLLLFMTLLSGCGQQSHTPIQLNQPDPEVVTKEKNTAVIPLRVAVSSILSPKETMNNYEGLIHYLQSKLEKPVVLLQRKTYREVNDLVQEGGADIAFVCSGGFVAGNNLFGMELLVAPQVNGQVQYQSYIITRIDSGIDKLSVLKGHSFAFTDPMSFSGRIAPVYMISRLGMDPEAFFGRTFYTYSHDNAIKAVVDGIVDAAAVDSMIFDYALLKDPGVKEKVKIIDKSFMVGTPPVVVNPQVNTETKNRIKAILLAMHQDTEGKKALEPLQIDRFIDADERNYALLKNVWLQLRDKL